MTQYKIHVTNISQAVTVLTSNGYEAVDGGTYVQFQANKEQKMDIIVLLNKHNIVLYDIEEF